MRRAGRLPGNAQLIAEMQAMPLRDEGGDLHRHTGPVGRLLVPRPLLAVERADKQLDLARPAEQEKSMAAAGDVCRGQPGDDRDDRLRPWNLGVQTAHRVGRQPASHVRGDLDHAFVCRVGQRGAEGVERPHQLGFEDEHAEHHGHPERHADHAEQRPTPVGGQRGEVDPPEGQPSGPQWAHHRSPTDESWPTRSLPSTRCSSREP